VNGVGGVKFMRRFFLLVAINLVISAPLSSAHTSLVSATPQQGSQVSESWKEISLQFDEDLISIGDKDPNKIWLLDSDGVEYPIGHTVVVGSIARASLNASTMKTGTYSVHYRVVSGDGHVVSSEFTVRFIGREPLNSSELQSTFSAPEKASPKAKSRSENGAASPLTVPGDHHNHQSFFHVHSGHIYFSLLGLAFVVLWILIRRRDS
jgi:methionine-rich copper-binding protein CopC